MQRLSPKRARLASFEHAYAIGIRLRGGTGADQFIVRSDCPIQPVRVTSAEPGEGDTLLALII